MIFYPYRLLLRRHIPNLHNHGTSQRMPPACLQRRENTQRSASWIRLRCLADRVFYTCRIANAHNIAVIFFILNPDNLVPDFLLARFRCYSITLMPYRHMQFIRRVNGAIRRRPDHHLHIERTPATTHQVPPHPLYVIHCSHTTNVLLFSNAPHTRQTGVACPQQDTQKR